MTDIEEMGPIDWVLLEFRGPLTGEAAPPLLDLVDRGLIRILDILFIRKEADGTVEVLNISDLPDDQAVHISVFEGASSGLLGQDDVDAAGEVLEPDTTAVMLVTIARCVHVGRFQTVTAWPTPIRRLAMAAPKRPVPIIPMFIGEFPFMRCAVPAGC